MRAAHPAIASRRVFAPLHAALPIFARRVCPGLFLWLCAVTATVQAQYSFKSWTADTGLPQNTVYDIRQTRDGYLWLTTSDGLARFDGNRFTVFNKSNAPGISNNRFLWLHEDAQGALWASTEAGGVVRYQHDSFSSYGGESGLTSLHAVYMTDDANGDLLTFLINDDVLRWRDGKFLPAGAPSDADQNNQPAPRESRRVPCLKKQSRIACLLHESINSWTRADGLPSLNLAGEFGVQDSRGTLWLATADAGLVQIEHGRVTKVYTEREGLPGRPLFLMASERVGLFSLDGRGALWLTDLESWQHRMISRDAPPAITQLGSATAYADREGNLWFGTVRAGLFRASPQTIISYSVPEGLTQNNVYPIYEDRNGVVWMGTTEGLFRYADGRFVLEPGMSKGEITALAEDRAGRLLVAKYNEVWVREGGGFRLLYRKETGVFWTIYADDMGALWFGWDQGLIHYQDGAADTYTTKDGLAGDDVKVIVDDGAGGFWIGTYGGLSHYKAGQLSSWREQDGLPSQHVRALYRDADGALWIGTYDGGLGRFKDGRFTRYNVQDGLFNDGVFQILDDGRGQFWLSCNRGIYRVSRHDLEEIAAGRRSALTSVAYGKADGMLNVECNGGRWPAGIRTRDGRLWFPTQDGVAVVAPASVVVNPQPPPVMIESCLVEGVPAALDRAVEIQPGQASFEIGYTALSFINSEYLRFRYKLEGLDDEWIEAGTRRTAYYTHVLPGSYTFRVVAANSDGVWNTEGAALRLTVHPYFYRTWWFLALAAACVLALGFAFYRARVNGLKRSRALQVEFSRKLLASQEEERQRIAAALHDSLGQSLLIIKNRVALAQSDIDERETVAEQLDELSHSATSVIEECREIAYNLRPYQIKRFGLSRTLQAIFLRLNEVTEIRATAEVDEIDDLLTDEAQTSVYRIVQECVNNIIRHSHATEAALFVKRASQQVTLLIEDNGRGFIQTEGVDDGAGRGGFGLLGIAERVKLMHGACEIDSERGTRIRVTIPTDGVA